MIATSDLLATHVGAIDPIHDSRWDRLVEGHPESTAFHTSAWARVLTEILSVCSKLPGTIRYFRGGHSWLALDVGG